MICGNCKIDRLVTDFINNQKFCYRCVYREKLAKARENRTNEPIFCRLCKTQIVNKENPNKRQRTVFCSRACAKKGHNKQLKSYWVRKVGPQDWDRKKAGIKWSTNQK